MTTKRETRTVDLQGSGMEIRANDDGGATLVGYAAIFGSLSEDMGGWRETIASGAFNRTLANTRDILVTLNHNMDALLGRTGAGTASVSVDERGVRYEVDLPATSVGKDVEILTSRGDLFGSSFTFATLDDSFEKTDDGVVRTLHEVRLYELGPVASPAYLDTTVAVRSLEAFEEAGEEENDGETLHIDIEAEVTVKVTESREEENEEENDSEATDAARVTTRERMRQALK